MSGQVKRIAPLLYLKWYLKWYLKFALFTLAN